MSLPNVICRNHTSSSMPSIKSSNTRGKLLQKDSTNLNPKFKFYARKRSNQLSKDQIADL